MRSKKLVCTCKNAYQDARYGKNMRVMNLTERGSSVGSSAVYRCTVCKAEVTTQK